MLPTLIRFYGLKARGIVQSWAQLKHLQDKHGFPAGRLLSPQVRAWTEEEVAAWLETRPTDKTAPRGMASPEFRAARDARIISDVSRLETQPTGEVRPRHQKSAQVETEAAQGEAS